MKKNLAIFSLSLYTSAKADWLKMNQDYNDLVYQKVEALANNTDLYDFSEDFESIVKKLTTVDLSIIEDYGCYCNFNKKHGDDSFRTKAKGRPLDEVDRFCKVLHDGYTCGQVDSQGGEDEKEESDRGRKKDKKDDKNKDKENDNTTNPEATIDPSMTNCKPWEVKYQSAFNNGLYHDLRKDQLTYLCEKSNGKNTCSSIACQTEGWFVQSFFNYYATGGRVDLSNLKHSNGFKHKNNCFGNIKKTEELGCCNSYPLRYPFRNKDGTRKCCKYNTYNMFTHHCCEDGRVRMNCDNTEEDQIVEPYVDIFLNNDSEAVISTVVQNKDEDTIPRVVDRSETEEETMYDPNEIIIRTDDPITSSSVELEEIDDDSILEPLLITEINEITSDILINNNSIISPTQDDTNNDDSDNSSTKDNKRLKPDHNNEDSKNSNNVDKEQKITPEQDYTKKNRIKTEDISQFSARNAEARKNLKDRLLKLGLIDKL